MLRVSLAFVTLLASLGGCADPRTGSQTAPLECEVQADCAPSGGACVDGRCRADNQCVSDAACPSGQTCAPDADFGGLCGPPGRQPQALPAWSCAAGQDCPQGEGCGADGQCHTDGECHLTLHPDGSATHDCGAGRWCAVATIDRTTGVGAGFCTSRSEINGNCRSDGQGACRAICEREDDCRQGSVCVDGFCHSPTECDSDAACGPNETCVAQPEGYGTCIDVDDPSCTPTPDGACRLACAGPLDCIHGGGCGADGFCHAANECALDADCATGEVCYESLEFGGLCGPVRP
ncbi:MAG: hypothetical protein KBG48_03795 [Kofleriaceae bacterium]|jgi:hypothetical protein|nr:hypothetical protein [Kofleriaceae bacterium]MBP9166479.1 hypothetical protein [Kofleriaceae bacterium]MBP9860290.1 hypothetical protein [Kofleriaceae bacterium]